MEAIKAMVWIAEYPKKCPDALKLLTQRGLELHFADRLSEAEMEALLPEIQIAIAGMNLWNEELLAKMPRLRLITKFGSGVDNIDLAAARRHGVDVCNTKGGNANAVAELVVGQMISVLRGLHLVSAEMKEGRWVKRVGREVKGKTIGLIGFGLIARRVAELLQNFDATLLACDLYPNFEEAQRLRVSILPMEQVLAEADIISLHVPGGPSNVGLIGEKEFTLMKDGAYFINSARAQVVQQDALVRALRSGKVQQAAIDVFCQEPANPEDPLLPLPNTLCSAHYGGCTQECIDTDSMTSAQAVLDALAGKTPKNLLN